VVAGELTLSRSFRGSYFRGTSRTCRKSGPTSFTESSGIRGSVGLSAGNLEIKSCCGSGKGSERSETAFMALKMPVVAPMPSVKVRIAVAAKPGCLSNCRMATFRSTQTLSTVSHCHTSRCVLPAGQRCRIAGEPHAQLPHATCHCPPDLRWFHRGALVSIGRARRNGDDGRSAV
jgi:hypothetical protein